MESTNYFLSHLLETFPFAQWSKRRVCLAVSGGADSVALLRSFTEIAQRNELQKNLLVVTVDHGIRGQESTEDALFVERLAKKFGLEFVLRRVDRDELLEETKCQGSLESAARNLRYRLLIESAHSAGARFIATAHHRDDQLETLLFRLFRGSGLAGLRGMAPYRPIDESLTLVRPLLNVSKTEILEYLQEIHQNYRTDSSNASLQYDRNRIRLELIPMLDRLFPNRWQKSLLRLAKLANETETYFEEQLPEIDAKIEEYRQIEGAYQKVLAKMNVPLHSPSTLTKDRIDLPLQAFINCPEEIIRRYFRKIWKKQNWGLADMGAEEWNRLTQALKERKTIDQLPNNIIVTFPYPTIMRLEKKRYPTQYVN